ncbi:MAG TPA: glycoside hydrolase family 15 protein [Bacillota bacterium]|nr:glycoside hydrolase family 15 protein [Bacillota bacterium]
MHDTLVDASISLITNNQHASGAYIASPSFPTYAYCWLRDGTYTAHAMDLYGEHESAKAFFRWVNATISSNRADTERTSDAIEDAEPEGRRRAAQSVEQARRLLRARWTLDGKRDNSEWPNYQPDGYGAWLWGLDEHIERTGDLGLWHESREAVGYVVECLSQVWSTPSSDCWEEYPDRIHTSTLICIAGGLERIGRRASDDRALSLAAAIRDYIIRYGVFDGRLAKLCSHERRGDQWPPKRRTHAGPSIGDSVDASLLWAAVPYGVLDPADPRMVSTVSAIERGLVSGGGVRRYAADTYYGGGLWPLLTAWLGWYYCRTGDREKALGCLRWVENQATDGVHLPEQVNRGLVDPVLYEPWVTCWGPPANPLLWSHAMYLILRSELDDRAREV